jgi:hypothetical protein
MSIGLRVADILGEFPGESACSNMLLHGEISDERSYHHRKDRVKSASGRGDQ